MIGNYSNYIIGIHKTIYILVEYGNTIIYIFVILYYMLV